MQLEITFSYPEPYLPSKRHKKPRERCVEVTMPFEVSSIDASSFPTAFITHEFNRYREDTEEYYLSEQTKMYKAFNGKLFRLLNLFNEPQHVHEALSVEVKELLRKTKYAPQKPVTKETTISNIQAYLDGFIIVDGQEVWKKASEPVYYIQYVYSGLKNPINIVSVKDYEECPLEDCFNALQKEEAKAYCEQKAKIYGIYTGPCGHIEVLIPEMVKCDPQVEYVMGELSK